LGVFFGVCVPTPKWAEHGAFGEKLDVTENVAFSEKREIARRFTHSITMIELLDILVRMLVEVQSSLSVTYHS
jgi:hypothetical protein